MAVQQTATFLATGEQVWQAAHVAVQQLGWAPSMVNPAAGTFKAETSTSLASWGEDYYFKVWDVGPGQAAMSVDAKLKFGLTDFGRRKRKVAKLLASIPLPRA